MTAGTGRSQARKGLDYLKRRGMPVIIFGAGIVGEAVLAACRDARIKIECFCDNNINKTKSKLCGLEVVYTPRLKDRYETAVFIISAADIKDVVGQLTAFGYSKWYSCGALLRDFDVAKLKLSAPADFTAFAVDTAILCHDRFLTPDKLFLRSVDIIITERCSLRCRDCSNLMQYYERPADCDIGKVLRSIDVFSSVIDGVNEFRVIGGEPFMNRQFHLIVKRLISEPKARRVVIYTNGTIVPGENQIGCMKGGKVLVIITDYGRLSRNRLRLERVLKRDGIAFYVLRLKGWADCGRIVKHNRAAGYRERVFAGCCAKNVVTLSGGRLYRCPFSANAARLRAVPDHKGDYVDMFRSDGRPAAVRRTKERIRKFLSEKKYLETCDYCSGRPFEADLIKPAIQAREPLKYYRYRAR